MENEISERSFTPLTSEHLARLSDLAAADRERFYAKQPDFRGWHIATVLAQGAALHWINCTNGVKDFDVWSFFALPPGFQRFPADIRTSRADFGPSVLGRQKYDAGRARCDGQRRLYEKWSAYRGRRVDLFLRALTVPRDADPVLAIRAWLRNGSKRSSPWWLSQKAVVLIDPAQQRGDQVWP